jgi:periplasmic protein TonB
MSYRGPKPPSKLRQRLITGALLLLVVGGGIASFLLNSGGPTDDEEEIVIVDLSLPPPPPPPPPPVPEEDLTPPEESFDEAPEISDVETPDNLSSEPTTDIDLGIDAGDLATGPGGAFSVSLPRFSRGGPGGGDSMLEDISSPPAAVSKIQPNYPSSLLSKGIGGRVLIVCVVDDKGQVASTTIRQSAGHPDLDKAAIAAVTKWKFKPAMKGGRPVRASCTVPFNFEVKKN